LEAKGLITTKRGLEEEKLKHGKLVKRVDTRVLMVSLTNAGKLAASWIEI